MDTYSLWNTEEDTLAADAINLTNLDTEAPTKTEHLSDKSSKVTVQQHWVGIGCPTATAPDQTESHVSLNQLGRIFVVDDRLPAYTDTSIGVEKDSGPEIEIGSEDSATLVSDLFAGEKGGGRSKYCTVGR